ncbi:MAG: sigma-70 family RNA polymerase sigma factor [Mycobacteriales bacterium]
MPDYRMTLSGTCALSVATGCLNVGAPHQNPRGTRGLTEGLAALRAAIWFATQSAPTTALRLPGQDSRLGGRRTVTAPLPLQPSGGRIGTPGDPDDDVDTGETRSSNPHGTGSDDTGRHRRPDRDESPDSDDSPGEIWDIVHRAQQGDADAFGEIYDRYLDTVYRYIFFRVGTAALAEDLASETFLRALRRISSVTWQGRDLGAWLVTIARNLIADHYKSGRSRLEISTPELAPEEHVDHGSHGQPEAQTMEHLTNRTLMEAVVKLPVEQQECIVLRFLDGMSVGETAQAMGKNDGAIKALQYRAVRALGRLLPEGFTP